MYTSLLLVSMFFLTLGKVSPPGPSCACVNPFQDHLQSHFGGKEQNCKHNGYCFVDCDSDCGDVTLATGRAARSDRCVSRAACHEDAKKSKFAVNKMLALKTNKPHENEFVLSGTGLVSAYQGHGLGLYTYNNNTGYYVQEVGDYYLLKDRSGWFTFPRISGCNETDSYSCIGQYTANLKSKNLIGRSWSFSKDEVWTEDDSIQFLPLNSSSCLMCKAVILNSTGPAIQIRPDYFGTFKKTPTYSAGRPVYKNSKGKFLMMKNEYTSFSVWEDTKRRVSAGKGQDEGTRGLTSGTGPTCVTEVDGTVPGRQTQGWQYRTKTGEWVLDETISVKCVE